MNGLTHFLEQFTVFCPLNTTAAGAEKFNAAFLQNALLLQLHRKIQTSLSANARNDRIRPLVSQNLSDIFQSQRLHVYLIGDGGIRHDRCGIGVTQDDLISFFF